MARGIALPTKAINGRLRLSGGDDYIAQLVMTALGDSDSDNPFQDIGLGSSMIFGVNSNRIDGEIRKRAEAAFTSLERDKLAKFDDVVFRDEGSEKTMFVVYINLETGQREETEVPDPPGGA